MTKPLLEFRTPQTEDIIRVNRVTANDAEGFAPLILNVLHSAYSRVHVRLGILTQEAVDRQFDPEHEANIERQKSNIEDPKATYYAAYLGDAAVNEVAGIAKTTPSQPAWRPLVGPANCYLNDIAVSQPNQGAGSALLRTAIDEYSDNRWVVADLPVMNGRTQEWFGRRLFSQVGIIEEALVIGSESLQQVRHKAKVGDAKLVTEKRVGPPHPLSTQ